MRKPLFLLAVALLLLKSILVVPAFAAEHDAEVTVEEDTGEGDSGDGEEDTTTDGTTADNSPPVAFAGQDQTVSVEGADAEAVVVVTLDGSLSSDPDGTDTIVSYEWSDQDGNFTDVEAVVEFELAEGEYVFTLVVTDDQGASDSASATITVIAADQNLPPIADAGTYDAVRIEEDADPAVAAVTLDGSASTDPDGDETIATFEWFDGDGEAVGAEAVVEITLEEGIHVITLVVTDDQGEAGIDVVTITVLAADAPEPESGGSGDGDSEGDSDGDSEGDSEDGEDSTDGKTKKKSKKSKGKGEQQNALRVLITKVLPNVPDSAKSAILKAIARISERLGIDPAQIGVDDGKDKKDKPEKDEKEGKSDDAKGKGKGKGSDEDGDADDGEDADKDGDAKDGEDAEKDDEKGKSDDGKDKGKGKDSGDDDGS